MLKKIVSLSLTLILVFALFSGGFCSLAFGDDDPGPIITGDLYMYTDVIPEFKAGEINELILIVQNRSAAGAYFTSIVVEDVDEALFSPDGTTKRLEVNEVRGFSKREFNFKFNILDSVETGYYRIRFTADYRNYSGGVFYTRTCEIKVYISNGATKPSVSITNIDYYDRSPVGDDKIGFNLELENKGTMSAREVIVRLGGLSSDTFTPEDLTGTVKLPQIAGAASETVNFVLRVNTAVKTGTYPIPVEVSYKDTGGKEYKYDTILYIPIERGSKGSDTEDIFATGASITSGAVGESNKAAMAIDFINRSGADVTDVRVSLADLSPETFSQVEDFGAKTLASLANDAKGRVSFSVYVSPRLSTGSYPITVNIEYKKNGVIFTTIQQIYVAVNRPSEGDGLDKVSKPRVIVSAYDTSAEFVNAGEPFMLNFTLHNTSRETAIKNATLIISSKDGVFIPVEGANSFFIEQIAADGTWSGEIPLTTKMDAVPASYPIEFRIEYEDMKNNPYNSSYDISLPVIQQQRLEVTNVMVEEYVMEGRSFQVFFQYINKGKSPLYNMSIEIKGPFIPEDGEGYRIQYVGNFNAGYTDYFETYYYATGTGPLEGVIEFSYEDISGNIRTYEHPFSVYIEEMSWPVDKPDPYDPFDPGYPGDMTQPGGSLSTWQVIAVIAGSVIVAGGVTLAIVLRVRKSKKKELMADED